MRCVSIALAAVSRLVCLTVLLAAAAISHLHTSQAQAVEFKVVAPLKGESRPDLPCCQPFYLWGTPVIAGDYVVFASRNGPPDGIWSYNIATKTLVKLAGFETKVPGGAGNFGCFCLFFASDYTGPTIGGDLAVFYGVDQNGVVGIYTIPVGGGTIRRVVSTAITAPDGTNFTYFARASLDQDQIVFYGESTGPGRQRGIFKRRIKDGATVGSITTVIDQTTLLDARAPSGPIPEYYGHYGAAVTGNKVVSFTATGLFDPSTGANSIFQARNGFRVIADNMTKLPGNPNADNHIVVVHRFSADFGSGAVAFYGAGDGGYRGIFKAKSATKTDGAFVTNETPVPDTNRKFAEFVGFGYDDTGLAFTANFVNGDGVFFAAGPGQPIDTVARHGSKYFHPIVGDRSVSNGRIVFSEASNFGETFYVATPKAP